MMTMPVIGAPNTLAQQGLGDTDNTPTNAPIPPMPSVSMPSAPPMPASAPPSPMPPQLRPQATQGNGLNEVLKQILPMLVSGIVARKGGAQAGSAVLEGMAFGQEQRRKREDEQLQAQMLLDQQDMKTRQESEQRRFERETKLAAFVSDIAKNTATLDDPAAFAQAIDLAESMAQRVYGAPAGFIKGQIKFNDSKRLEKERKDAQSILDNLQKRYGGDDPNWIDSMIQSGATVGGKSVADLAALVNMDVKTATGEPVEIGTPIRTVGSAEDAAKAAVEEARREARRNKKPFTQADATRVSQGAIKQFKAGTQLDERPKAEAASDPKRKAVVDAIMNDPTILDRMTNQSFGEYLPDLVAAGFNDFGKALPQGAVDKISASRSAIASVKDLRDVVKQNEQHIGPIAGYQALNPWSEARKAQADIDRVRQRVGKALEGGVLRKEDEEKYKKILATLNDEPSTAIYKIDKLVQDLERDIEIYVGTQRQSGRRTSGVSGASAANSLVMTPPPDQSGNWKYVGGKWVPR